MVALAAEIEADRDELFEALKDIADLDHEADFLPITPKWRERWTTALKRAGELTHPER